MNSDTFNAKFPIYSLAYHQATSSLILGGGGGPSRSGIPNGLILLKLTSSPKTKSKFSLEEAGELRTGDEAVMSLSIYDDKTDCLVVAGVNDRCWLLEFEATENKSGKSPRVSSMVKALNNGQSISSNNTTNNSLLNLLRTIQSDSSPNDDGYLRVTRFTASGRSFLAAGSDGCLREWTAPEMRLLAKVETDSEILDADGKDENFVIVTSLGQIQLNLTKDEDDPITLKPSQGFAFKFVRFFDKNSLGFLAVENFKVSVSPNSSKSSKKNPKLVFFNGPVAAALKLKKSYTLPIPKNCTCFIIEESSDHLAFGFADGSLLIISIKNPSAVYLIKKLAHPFPVTGLAIDSKKGILLSSSADGQILIHQIPSKATIPSPSSLFLLFFIILTIVFLLISIFSRNLMKLTEIEDFDSFYNLFPTEQVEL